jgi:hypothetical protein
MLGHHEVAWCYLYEEARSDPDTIQYYKDWREGCCARSFEQLRTFAARRCENGEVWPPFFALWPEWPAKPFLAVPSEIRRRRLGNRDFFATRPLEVVPIRFLLAYRDAIYKASSPFLGAEISDTLFLPQYRREIVTFQIDWDESPEKLKARFAEWIRSRRELRGLRFRPSKANASTIVQWRKQLIDLGMWRLLHAGLNWRSAHRHVVNVSGTPICSPHASAWSRAKSRAETATRGLAWHLINRE